MFIADISNIIELHTGVSYTTHFTLDLGGGTIRPFAAPFLQGADPKADHLWLRVFSGEVHDE
jgi:hypothetical protein